VSPFVPTDPRLALLLVLGVPAGILLAGHALVRAAPRGGRTAVLLLLCIGTFVVERLATHEPAGVRMLALIVLSMSSLKLLVALNERHRGMPPLSFGAWVGFAGGWLGMQPRLFQTERRRPLDGAATLLRRGCWNATLGACTLVLARATRGATDSVLPETALALVGSSLLLHFGVCHVLAGAWRLAGVPCEPLFRDPLQSESLSEFWGRRWNLAFSELTASVVYKPLATRIGRGAALGASFLWSGLLHEMAISVPVRAGFGLPTLYFVLHGALVSLERALARAGRPMVGRGGRLWTLFWLVAPLPLLAHAAFVSGIVTPLLAAAHQLEPCHGAQPHCWTPLMSTTILFVVVRVVVP
jgi:hypothetical protein